MSGQLSMDDVTAYRYAGELPHENTPTSWGAAEAAEARADTDARRVFRLIRDAGRDGLTDDEGETLLAMRHTTYSARRRGLVLDGLVTDSGRRRLTSAGRPATVWTANHA